MYIVHLLDMDNTKLYRIYSTYIKIEHIIIYHICDVTHKRISNFYFPWFIGYDYQTT